MCINDTDKHSESCTKQGAKKAGHCNAAITCGIRSLHKTTHAAVKIELGYDKLKPQN